MKILLGAVFLTLLLTTTAADGEVSAQAFTPNEFKALYELMVQYKYGRANNCPLIIKYDAEPVEDGTDLLIRHRDMKMGNNQLENCTDVGVQRITLAADLRGGKLNSFLESIDGNLDKTTVFNALQNELAGRKYYLSISDSSRTCGVRDSKWFERSETFFYFDESDTIRLTLVAKITGGEPMFLSVPLVGNIRYMIAVTSGTTCIYRVQTDVANVILGTPRPSDTPSTTPRPSTTSTPSAGPSQAPVVSSSSSSSPAASTSVSPSSSPSLSSSPVLESPSSSSTPSNSPSASATSSPLVSQTPSTSPEPVPVVSTAPSSTPSPSISNTPTTSASMSSIPPVSPFPSSTPSTSASASTSSMPSQTPTSTPSTSPTRSSTPRPSSSSTQSPTPTPTPTPMTPTPSPTSSSTSTASSSQPPQPPLPSLPPSSSPSPTSSSSLTPQKSQTATKTPTPSTPPIAQPTTIATPFTNPTSSPSETPPEGSVMVPLGSGTPSPTPSSLIVPLGSATPSTSATPTPSVDAPAPGNIAPGNQFGSDDRNSSTIDGTSTCFPASAKVELFSGEFVEMRNLAIGDLVWSGREYSKVIMFTHQNAQTVSNFVRLTTASGNTVTLSEGHYLYVNDLLKPAREAQAGDVLRSPNGTVVKTEKVLEKGLYNPQTENGEIVVNGVTTSCYTETVVPMIGHALLAPLRMAKELFPGLVGLVGERIEAAVDGSM